MIEYLDAIDKQILLYLNGMHCGFFDVMMWWVSKTATWMLMMMVFLFIIFKNNWRWAVLVTICIALTIVLADQISSGLIKDVVERLRPTHNPEIGSLVHVVNGYRGGQFGFVSSHAANTIGVAIFVSLLFSRRGVTCSFLLWATLVSYSRIYLGVHYLGDILGGACVGLLCGVVIFALYKYVVQRFNFAEKWKISPLSDKNAKIMQLAILSNLLITVGVSCFYVM